VKAITIDPVWAWAIVYGHKRVENRTWHTRHRGRLAIHASAESSRSRRADAEAREILASIGVTVPDEVPTGAIVGTVKVVDSIRLTPQGAFGFASLQVEPLATGPVCWLFENPKRLRKPIPAKGSQGLWTTDLLVR